MLHLGAIANAQAVAEPFPFFFAEGVLDTSDLAAIRKDFPRILKPGLFLASELTYGPAFAQLISAIKSPELEALMEKKFDVDLSDKPLFITVRGHCQKKDGRVHTDSKDKIVTCLLYLNETWDETGGRLRLLRSGTDLSDVIVEIPPHGGTLIAFKRTDNSWHGHEKFEGPRRYIMFNWVRSRAALAKNILRHKLSATFKGMNLFSDY